MITESPNHRTRRVPEFASRLRCSRTVLALLVALGVSLAGGPARAVGLGFFEDVILTARVVNELIQPGLFRGVGTLEETSNVFFSREEQTSLLSGSFSYITTLGADLGEPGQMTILDFHFDGTPLTFSHEGLSANTGNVDLDRWRGSRSTGNWDPASGEIDVIFPYRVMFENSEFVDFLTFFGEPPPFFIGQRYQGSYAGEIPAPGAEITEGTMTLTASLPQVPEPELSPLVLLGCALLAASSCARSRRG